MKRVPPSGKKTKSQIVVVMTVIVAILFVFALAFVNIAKVSDVKTLTAMAADRGALSLGSKLGTLSNLLLTELHSQFMISEKYNIDWPGKKYSADGREVCVPNWLLILSLASILVGGILAFAANLGWLTIVGTLMMGVGGAYVLAEIHGYRVEGSTSSFARTSFYTSFREQALLDICENLPVTDSVMATGGGNYFSDPSTGVGFNLKDSPIQKAIKGKSRIPRWSAWYYSKRFPLVSEEELAKYIHNEFIKDLMDNKMYFDDTYWNSENWLYDKLSLAVPVHWIPCAGDVCPPWISTKEPRKVIVLGPVNREEKKGESFWFAKEMKDGFLVYPTNLIFKNDHKGFRNLCRRLIHEYDNKELLKYSDEEDGFIVIRRSTLGAVLSFKWLPWIGLQGITGGVNAALWDEAPLFALAEDLRGFVLDTVQLANKPISERLIDAVSWVRLWYDWDKHAGDGTPLGGEKDGSDVHARLYRTIKRLEKWIEVLRKVNNELILPDMLPNGSYCEQGRGEPVATCYTYVHVCHCYYIDPEYGKICTGDNCEQEEWARWEGPYGTCTKSCGFLDLAADTFNWITGGEDCIDGTDHMGHPTCIFGDLYGAIPAWCTQLRPHVPCKENSNGGGGCLSCDIPETKVIDLKGFIFQGQLAWNNTAELTEVEQAIEILTALKDNLKDVCQRIQTLAQTMQNIIEGNEDVKNELVYCWDDDKGGYHLIRARIDGYPSFDDFPHIVETREFKNFIICRKIIGNLTGEFTITVSRYDTDMPGFWWNMRRRKLSGSAPQNLGGLMQQIMSSGKGDAGGALSSAIESKTKGTYGPAKGDITITRIQ